MESHVTQIINTYHGTGPVPWRSLAADGIHAMITKRGEGGYMQDNSCDEHLVAAAQANIIPGEFYFPAEPFSDPAYPKHTESIGSQMERFVELAGASPVPIEEKAMALDFEDPKWFGETGHGELNAEQVYECVFALHKLIPEHPIVIYSGRWWWDDRIGIPHEMLREMIEKANAVPWSSRYPAGHGQNLHYLDMLARVPDSYWRGSDRAGFGGQPPTLLQYADYTTAGGKENLNANAARMTPAIYRRLVLPREPAGDLRRELRRKNRLLKVCREKIEAARAGMDEAQKILQETRP